MSNPTSEQRFHVPWRIRDPLLVLVWTYAGIFFLAVMVIVGLRLTIGPSFMEDPIWSTRLFTESPAVELWALIQGLLVLLFLSRRVFKRWNVSADTWFRPSRFRSDVREAIRLYFMALILSAFVVFGISSLVHLVAGLLGHADPSLAMQKYLDGLDEESSVLLGSRIGWLRVVVLSILIPPIEELLFRGCLYPALRKRFKPWSANLLSSAVFAISHHYAFGLPNILVIGILGAYAYERTRSLWTPIVFHMLWNLGASATVKPEVWWVLVPAVLILAAWSWRFNDAFTSQRRIEGRRLGWKVYTVLYVALSMLSLLADTASVWFAWLDIPMWVGLFAFAWKRQIASVLFWRVYACVFLLWLFLEWWATMLPAEALTGWQRLLALSGSEPAASFAELFFMLAGVALIVGPALVVLFRLSRIRIPVQKTSL